MSGKNDAKPYKAPRDWSGFWLSMKALAVGLVVGGFILGTVALYQHNDHNARVKFGNTCTSLHGVMFVTDDNFQCVVGKTMISQAR